jgi:ATP-dependent Clp protease adaptor protein ClpS
MPDTKTKTSVRPRIAPREQVETPNDYNVIYVNDDVTTQDFVIETLTSVFNYAKESAETLTLRVHEEGSAVVATLPYELAEQKGIEVTLLARSNGFPLQVKIQSE